MVWARPSRGWVGHRSSTTYLADAPTIPVAVHRVEAAEAKAEVAGTCQQEANPTALIAVVHI